MEVMLVGGSSPMARRLCLKLYKEGHRIYVLSGTRDRSIWYGQIYERYDFPYESASVQEVFRSVQPDVTIVCGAFDGNLTGKDPKREAVRYAAGLQNILLSWSALEKGRLVYLSSAEVYGNSYSGPVTEEIPPMPQGIRPLMLFQAEESCRFYQEKLHKDVVILRMDRLHDVPQNHEEAVQGICQQKCLTALQTGEVTYREGVQYGFTYLGDAVECVYKLTSCEKHRHSLYHVSAGRAFSERQIAETIRDCLGGGVKLQDNSVGEHWSVVLNGERLREEFGFTVWREPEETIRLTLEAMQKHGTRYFDSSYPGWSLWRRLCFWVTETLGVLVPYIETLILFIPFFMLNNRATGSQYFSKIDFYLIYVLLFAVVHGQRQATFAGLLATAGYLFRQMYSQSGIAVVTDYNTYVWIAEIFIVGLVVGYMKDQLAFLREEHEQEMEFLSEQVTDIGDINDSNLRVKESLIHQVVNNDENLGVIYALVDELEKDQPTQMLFHALALLQDFMNCRDVALYLINREGYARLFGYTSAKARALGRSVYLPDHTPLQAAVSRQQVYLNRGMDPQYPMMAYSLQDAETDGMMILLWDLPFERMTIAESNRLIVISKLIRKSVNRASAFQELLLKQRYQEDTPVLQTEVFEELLQSYREAGSRGMTQCMLLRVTSAMAGEQMGGRIISDTVRSTDYCGTGRDGGLYILLTGTDRDGCGIVQRNLAQKGIETVISEEIGV